MSAGRTVSEKAELADVAEIQIGYQSRKRIEEDLDGVMRIIRTQDVGAASRINGEQLMRFSPNKVDPKKYMIVEGDILLLARGEDHGAYLIEQPFENTVAANSFYIVRSKQAEKVLPRYLTWWLNQNEAQAYFSMQQGTSTMSFISKGALAGCPVIVPPLEQQTTIGALDQLWHEEQKLNTQLRKQKQRLIQAASLQAIKH